MTEAELEALNDTINLKIIGIDVQVKNLTDIIDLKLAALATTITALDDKLFTATRVQGEKVLLATTSLEHRLLEMMNQIHNLEKQTNLTSGIYLTKIEHEAWKEDVDKKLNTLHDFEIIVRTKASTNAVLVSYIISGVLFVINVIGFAIMIADRAQIR